MISPLPKCGVERHHPARYMPSAGGVVATILRNRIWLVVTSLNLALGQLLAQSDSDLVYSFTTLAGKSRFARSDGVGENAQIIGAYGIAVDSAGNVYVPDAPYHTIRKITPAGVTTTIAGYSGVRGTNDGTGSGARFYYPNGVAVDSATNLYVADSSNQTIRKLTPVGDSWVVTTIAGLPGSSGAADGIGSNARFANPWGITVDGATNLYLADTTGKTIRKITPQGSNWVVSTIAGVGFASGSADGIGSNARFGNPESVAVDGATNLYVTDSSNLKIRKLVLVNSNWMVSTFASAPAEPLGIGLDRSTNLYVGFRHYPVIWRYDRLGNWVHFAGSGGDGDADGTGSNAEFSQPYGIAVDTATNLYVVDGANNQMIRKVTAVGVVSTLVGSGGSAGSANGTGSNARFRFPMGMAVDSGGTSYVTDRNNHTIRKVTSAGLVTTLAGLAGASGQSEGPGNFARFNYPQGIAVDPAGNLFVADTGNHAIRKVTAAGLVSTFAGLAGSSGTNNGTGSDARFSSPEGVAVDVSGNVYVADSGNRRIRKISPTGEVSTFALLNYSPRGVAVDPSTNLYVVGPTRTWSSCGYFPAYYGCCSSCTIRDVVLADYPILQKFTPMGAASTLSVGASAAPISTARRERDAANCTVTTTAPHGLYRYHLVVISNIGGTGYNGTAEVLAVPSPTTFTYQAFSGSSPEPPVQDSGGTATQIRNPEWVAVDAAGNVFLTDTVNNTIRRVSSDGKVSTIGGSAEVDVFGSTDGDGATARFYKPAGIAVDIEGNLYVADLANNVIRKGVIPNYRPRSVIAYNRPTMSSSLSVQITPEIASGQWRFPWELGWRESGQVASNLTAGDYPIILRERPGWVAPPLNGPVTLTNGQAQIVNVEYVPTLSMFASIQGGTLTVVMGPAPPAGAGWRFVGSDGAWLPPGYSTNVVPGTYLIEFAEVAGRVRPGILAVEVTSGQTSFIAVSYPLATSPPTNMELPYPVPPGLISQLNDHPFGFNGQVYSEAGYGSGVAVETNVVLTAAHFVFNDQNLSYVPRAYWFHQRDAGAYDPTPLEARGYYVLSGYAAQRTNDLQGGYAPDQSTPASRNLDVAALFFDKPVAGGGHGGYLPSDAVPNTWLTSTQLKMLVGYPVDGSQFGANVVPGRMYQTEPQPYPLSLSPDPVPGQQQVYVAPWLLSFPGSSGGPLYVELNGYYYPAGVYLGTLFSGSLPYASLVRAIDSNVVSLITRAQSTVATGTNQTGGGIILVSASSGSARANYGVLAVQLAPTEAVDAQAQWTISQGPFSNSFIGATNMIGLTAPGPYHLTFKPLPGFVTPSTYSVLISTNDTSTNNGVLNIQLGASVTVRAPYRRPLQVWQETHFTNNATNLLIAGALADPDGDGILNIVEYALGLDPNVKSREGLPQGAIGLLDGTNFLTLTFNRPTNTSDITYQVLVGGDLNNWLNGSLYSATNTIPSNTNTTEVSRSTNGTVEVIVVRDNIPASSATNRFMRLNITQP
jgi:sugar lactone lactonase YvrE